MMLVIIIPMISVLALSSVQALGVAHSFLKDNVLHMNKDDRIDYKFILQNSDSSTKVMDFRIRTQFPMLVGSGSKAGSKSFYQEEFSLNPMTNNDFNVKFYSPSFAAKFPVTYSYKEVKVGSIGQIQVIQEVSSKFFISVDNSTIPYYGFGISDIYDNFYIYTDSPYYLDVDGLQVRDYNGTVSIFIDDYVDLSNMTNGSFALRYNYAWSNLSLSNKTARITFYDLPYAKKSNIRILRNGNDCGSYCKIIDYYSGDLIFDAYGFSEYMTVASSSSGGNGTTGTGSGGAGTSVVVNPPSSTQKSKVSNPIIFNDSDSKPVVYTDNIASQSLDNYNGNGTAEALSRLNMLRSAGALAGNQTVVEEGIFKKDGAKQLFTVMLYGFITLLASIYFFMAVKEGRYI